MALVRDDVIITVSVPIQFEIIISHIMIVHIQLSLDNNSLCYWYFKTFYCERIILQFSYKGQCVLFILSGLSGLKVTFCQLTDLVTMNSMNLEYNILEPNLSIFMSWIF